MRFYANIDPSPAPSSPAPTPEEVASLAKAIADPRRIALLQLMSDGKEHCVCNLATALSMPEFQVSRHLAPLKRLGLVAARREGTWMHYHACATVCASALAGLTTALSPKPLASQTGGSGDAGCCGPAACKPAAGIVARGRVRSTVAT